LVDLIRRHAGGGRVLDLGCGTGRLAASIPPDTWTTFTGVDLSPCAISRARARTLPRATFVEADFEKEFPNGPFDLIISEESLYYVATNRLPDFVERLEQRLAPEGKLLVTVADPRRFQGLIRLLMQHFHLVEQGPLSGDRREYLVLQREVHS
jgi:SAM-dependent methyltransferase